MIKHHAIVFHELVQLILDGIDGFRVTTEMSRLFQARIPDDTFLWLERGRYGFFDIMMKVLTELYQVTSQSSIFKWW